MKKQYQKPECEIISLISQESITDDFVDGSVGLEDSDF